MNLFTSVIALLIVLASTLVISSTIYETIVYGTGFEEYNKAKHLMSTIDKHIEYMILGILDSKELYMNVYKSRFDVSDEHDTMKYTIEMESKLEDTEEHDLIINIYNNTAEILLNYSGIVDIVGNLSKSNGFILYLERDNDRILVK